MASQDRRETGRMLKKTTRGMTHLGLEEPTEVENIDFTQVSSTDDSQEESASEKETVSRPPKLVPRRQEAKKLGKIPRAIVPSLHLSYLAAAYNLHFGKYSEGRKNITQLLPSKVWKPCYQQYMTKYPDSPFTQGTLKERLREALKEIKTGRSNDDNAEKVELQSEVLLKALKSTVGHAKRNILGRRQEILDGRTLNEDADEGDGDTELLSENLGPSTPKPGTLPVGVDDGVTSRLKSVGDGTKVASKKRNLMEAQKKPPMTKAQMLKAQSDSITVLVDSYAKTAGKREALLDLKQNLNVERQKKARLGNLRLAVEHKVITEEQFKTMAKEVLEL